MQFTSVRAAIIVSALSASIASIADCQTDYPTTTVVRKIPFTIGSAGEYKLAEDLSTGTNKPAIKVVNTANVVIDLNGHTLANTASVGIGITVENSDFVTIKNGTIYGFGYGVKLDGNSENTVVKKVTLANDTLGVYTAADKGVVEGCFINGPGVGSGIALAPNTTGFLAKNNQIGGFSFGIQSAAGSDSKYDYNLISNCNVGLYVYTTDEYTGNVFTSCSVNVQQSN